MSSTLPQHQCWRQRGPPRAFPNGRQLPTDRPGRRGVDIQLGQHRHDDLVVHHDVAMVGVLVPGRHPVGVGKCVEITIHELSM
jgi:hypothetical protein